MYVAVKYKNSMAIFDHYDDGWIVVHRRSKDMGQSSSPIHLSKAEEAELDLTMVTNALTHLQSPNMLCLAAD